MSDRPTRDPHAEVPVDARGIPDDRFDGTDSGPEGWDTPYPPVEPDAAPGSPDSSDPATASRGGDPRPTVPEREPSTAVDGTSYETDGPDEPADTPQR
jgi:hypothetical protein